MWKLTLGVLAFASACISGVYAETIDREAKVKAVAHYIVGVTRDLNGQATRAISDYEQSAALDPSQPMPHLRMATYYARTGMPDKAIRELKTVLAFDPSNTQAHYLLALVYSSQKKYDLAAKEYEGILKSASRDNPGNLEIHTYLAQLYYSQRKYQEAIGQFQQILRIQPDNVSANYLMGAAYLERHQRIKARELFSKVLMLEPENDEALNSLAYMHAEDSTNLDDALKMARKAVSLDPSNGAYYDTLGWVLYKKGLYSEALLSLQKAEVYVQDPVVCDHIGDVYRQIKEFSLARKYWRKSLMLQPHQPQVQNKLNELENLQAAQ